MADEAVEVEAGDAEAAPASERAGRATAITTFLRVRPHKRGGGYFKLPSEVAGGGELPEVMVDVPRDELNGLVNNKRTHWKFRFDGVLGESATQVHSRCFFPVLVLVL